MGRKISGSEFIIGYLSIFNDAFDLDLRKSTKIEDNKDLLLTTRHCLGGVRANLLAGTHRLTSWCVIGFIFGRTVGMLQKINDM